MSESTERDKVKLNVVYGNAGEHRTGYFGTLSNPGTCDSDWFRGQSTKGILGCGNFKPHTNGQRSGVRYYVKAPVKQRRDALHSFVIVGSYHEHAGLHGESPNRQCWIRLNGHTIESFTLYLVPAATHSDYFHIPKKIPEDVEFALSRSIEKWPAGHVYWWPVDLDFGNVGQQQILELEIDTDVKWDIDFVGIACVLRDKWHDKIWRFIGRHGGKLIDLVKKLIPFAAV